MSNYFLWKTREKTLAEIVATDVLEEATKDEINDVASLAETCLQLRGEDRPTMRQVEMTLQTVRSRRLKACLVSTGNEDAQSFQMGEVLSTRLSSVVTASMVPRADLAPQRSQNCYSLEQEFMSSATLPR